jgi:hypothetical protein
MNVGPLRSTVQAAWLETTTPKRVQMHEVSFVKTVNIEELYRRSSFVRGA